MWAAGSAVADVSDPWLGACVFDEDFAVEVGHSVVVGVDDDEDLLAGQPSVDFVADAGESDCTGGTERNDAVPVGRFCGCGAGRFGVWPME